MGCITCLQECRDYVLKAVTLAIGRDGSSGGCVRTVVVTEDGVKRDFVPNTQLQLPGEAVTPPQPVGVAA